MDLVSLAIWIIVIVAVGAIVYWFVQSSGINIPRPFQIALMAIVAIIAIILVVRLAGVGGGRVW